MQLKYDDEFNNIVDDIKIWNNDEIPTNVKEFINKISDLKVIHDEKTDKCYCSKCFTELSKKYYCANCHKKMSTNKYHYHNFINVDSIDSDIYKTEYFSFYVFDVFEGNVLLYDIRDGIHLFRTTHLIKINRMKINRVFLVKEKYLLELLTNKTYSYESLKKTMDKELKFFNEDNADLLNDEEQQLSELFLNFGTYLYTDNLLDLRNTVYKYTYIWNSTQYLKKHDVSLYSITVLPLANPCFEYLVKYRLYNLAYGDELLEFKKTFKDTFGVEKSHLGFMVKNDISYPELMILSFTGLEDMKVLRKMSPYYYELGYIYQTYGINIMKLINYFKKKHYKYDYLYEYADYISMCNELKYNLKDKRTIFPDNLLKEHNKVFRQYEIVKDSIIEEKIINVGKVLQVNKYEDNDYIIYPAPTLQSMIDESFNQNNCLKSYCEKYSNGETNIYFMRDKKNINKSLVTIEVCDNKVIQARIKNNALPDKYLMNVINNWEKKLIPIEFENCSN